LEEVISHCYFYGWKSEKMGGTPEKRMVYFMEKPIFQWMIWGEKPTIFSGNTHVYKATNITFNTSKKSRLKLLGFGVSRTAGS